MEADLEVTERADTIIGRVGDATAKGASNVGSGEITAVAKRMKAFQLGHSSTS